MKKSKLGIMQPYLFPYLGYFALIKHTDRWVVFDTAQYIKKGWINRNRIQSPAKDGISYLTVPILKTSRDTLIKEVKIDQSQDWRNKILGQLIYYKKKAPYYYTVLKLVKNILDFKTEFISELNVYALQRVCKYLNIEFNYCIFSKNTLNINHVNAPDEWALEISKKLHATCYINSPGGKSFFDKKKYKDAGIELQFLKVNLTPYTFGTADFIAGLSILDVIMYNTPEEVNLMLDNYELE